MPRRDHMTATATERAAWRRHPNQGNRIDAIAGPWQGPAHVPARVRAMRPMGRRAAHGGTNSRASARETTCGRSCRLGARPSPLIAAGPSHDASHDVAVMLSSVVRKEVLGVRGSGEPLAQHVGRHAVGRSGIRDAAHGIRIAGDVGVSRPRPPQSRPPQSRPWPYRKGPAWNAATTAASNTPVSTLGNARVRRPNDCANLGRTTQFLERRFS